MYFIIFVGARNMVMLQSSGSLQEGLYTVNNPINVISGIYMMLGLGYLYSI